MEPNTDVTFYNSMLACIQDELEAEAKDLYFRVHNHLSISLDDLIQEGRIGVWRACLNYDPGKVKTERSMVGYCFIKAKGAMQDYIKWHRRRYEREKSLEAHLEVKTEKGLLHREIEDKPTKYRETPKHIRERILNALRCLSTKQRLAVMIAFQIDDDHGMPASFTKLDSSTKSRGLKKLSAILGGAQ